MDHEQVIFSSINTGVVLSQVCARPRSIMRSRETRRQSRRTVVNMGLFPLLILAGDIYWNCVGKGRWKSSQQKNALDHCIARNLRVYAEDFKCNDLTLKPRAWRKVGPVGRIFIVQLFEIFISAVTGDSLNDHIYSFSSSPSVPPGWLFV